VSGPLDSTVFPYAVGIGGAAVMAAVALLYLDGTVMYAVLAVALVDAVVTPQILKRATG
jgi:hypothetical protein